MTATPDTPVEGLEPSAVLRTTETFALGVVVGGFLGAAVLLWTSQLAAAGAVFAAIALACCLLPVVPRLAALSPVSAPLAAVSIAQLVELALPLPLLNPPVRLGLQGLGLWFTLLGVYWAQPRERRARWRALRSGARTGAGWSDQPQLLLTGLAAGAIIGGLVAAVLPSYPQTHAGSTAGAVAEALVVALLLAVPEELLWRGLLTPELWKILGPAAVPFEAVLYACSYADSQRLAFVVLVLIAGAAASAVRRVSGSLRLPVVAHAAALLLAFVLLSRL